MGRISITVPDGLLGYAERQVSNGRFESLDAFFEEVARWDQDQQPLTLAELHERLDQAIASGVSPRRIPDIIRDAEEELRADGVI